MTREEAKAFLESTFPVLSAKMQLAIKTLEEEPFMNKPCVANQVCHEDKVKMLDKLRDEFISLYPKNYAGEPAMGGSACEFSLNKVLKITDKYKTK